jgi:hypothetical protein
MRGLWLRWDDQSIAIDAAVVIGRGDDCDVSLDDPLVSRRHAAVALSNSELWIDDLTSRNGVYVNGQRIQNRQRLITGDVLRIGGQEMHVWGDSLPPHNAASDLPQPTRRVDAMGVVGQLAEKALALGRVDEAERLLAGPLELVLQEAMLGLPPTGNVLGKSTDMVLKLLEATRRGLWLDWLVRVYTGMRKPWPAPVVDTLYQVARGSIGYDRQGLRAYCEVLRSVQSELGPAERFQVGRIEGLERVLSAL